MCTIPTPAFGAPLPNSQGLIRLYSAAIRTEPHYTSKEVIKLPLCWHNRVPVYRKLQIPCKLYFMECILLSFQATDFLPPTLAKHDANRLKANRISLAKVSGQKSLHYGCGCSERVCEKFHCFTLFCNRIFPILTLPLRGRWVAEPPFGRYCPNKSKVLPHLMVPYWRTA